MNKEKVLDILDKFNIPVSKIETDLGMPSGTLAKAKKGARPLPSKWEEPLRSYSDKYKSDIIESVLSYPAETNPRPASALWTSPSWAKEVEDYCSEAGIFPSDLVAFHKEFSALKLKPKKAKPNDYDEKKADRFKIDEAATLPSDNIKPLKEVAVHSKVAQKNHEAKELEPGTNAYFLRHGCWE